VSGAAPRHVHVIALPKRRRWEQEIRVAVGVTKWS
jgi:hypothetical protein